MASITGKIEAISKPNKGGYISIKVDGEWFSAGKEAPAAKGDTVVFDTEDTDYGPKILMKTFKVRSKSDAKGSGSDSAGSGAKSSTQDAIEYQCALKAAAEVTAALITSGRFKTLKDEEIDAEVVARAVRYHSSIKTLGGSAAPAKKPAKREEPVEADPDDELPVF